jgi:predicted nucleic acid-binding protein
MVALIVDQAGTRRVRELRQADVEMVAWMLSDVEVRSALERLRREGVLTREQVQIDIQDAERIWRQCRTIDLVTAVKLRAKRLLAHHALRAADALQLGAALLVADDDPARLELVTLDDRLAAAARREGFRVLPD